MVKNIRPLTEDEIFKTNYMRALNEKFKLRMQLAHLRNQLDDIDAINERMMDEVREKKMRADQMANKGTMPEPTNISPPHIRIAPSPPKQPSSRQPTPPRESSPLSTPLPESMQSPPSCQSPCPSPPPKPPPSIIPQKQVSFQAMEESPTESDIAEASPVEVVESSSSEESITPAIDLQPPRDLNALEGGLRDLQRQYREINLYAVGIILLLFSVLLIQNIKWHPTQQSSPLPERVKQPAMLATNRFECPLCNPRCREKNDKRTGVRDYDCEECNKKPQYGPCCDDSVHFIDGYICWPCPKSEPKRITPKCGRT